MGESDFLKISSFSHTNLSLLSIKVQIFLNIMTNYEWIFQVSLACSLKKPLFIHERDAHKEVLEVLRKYKSHLPSVVIHCFTGDASQAAAYLKEGCYIGLTGEHSTQLTSLCFKLSFISSNYLIKYNICFCGQVSLIILLIWEFYIPVRHTVPSPLLFLMQFQQTGIL